MKIQLKHKNGGKEKKNGWKFTCKHGPLFHLRNQIYLILEKLRKSKKKNWMNEENILKMVLIGFDVFLRIKQKKIKFDLVLSLLQPTEMKL